MIRFRDTSIGYDRSLVAVTELSLQRGRLYSLIGRNGAGKTTLFNTLLGLIPALEGSIWADGRNIHSVSPVERARIVAYVPSRFEGVQHLNTRDYIAMGRAPYTNFLGRNGPEDWKIVDAVIAQLGIGYLSDKDTSRLSDGERQIASIARALVQQTPVILLDEPTAFLDYANKIAVQRILREIAHGSGVCIVQSSHDLELCMEYSDGLLIIDQSEKTIVSRDCGTSTKAEVIAIAFPSALPPAE